MKITNNIYAAKIGEAIKIAANNVKTETLEKFSFDERLMNIIECQGIYINMYNHKLIIYLSICHIVLIKFTFLWSISIIFI